MSEILNHTHQRGQKLALRCEKSGKCLQCGAEIPQDRARYRAVYCSDKCRLAAKEMRRRYRLKSERPDKYREFREKERERFRKLREQYQAEGRCPVCGRVNDRAGQYYKCSLCEERR